jgi:hypothetical protein
LIKWLKKLIGRDTPNSDWWSDLLESREYRPVWPRIAKSHAWQHDLEPWFRQSLLFTLFELARERDPQKVIRLQERAMLLNEWLEAPVLALARENALLNNLADTNRLQMPEMERAI